MRFTLLLFTFTIISPTLSYVSFQRRTAVLTLPSRSTLYTSPDADSTPPKNDSSFKPKMERLMEGLSRSGRSSISDLSLTERTKRAMLAEKIEDEIFNRAKELDRLSDDEGRIPHQYLSLAKEIASQARLLQVQYDELVSGKESSVLNALEQAMEDDDDDGTSNRNCTDDDESSTFQ